MSDLTTKINELAVQGDGVQNVPSIRAIFEGAESARLLLDEQYNSVVSCPVINRKEAASARELRLRIVK